MRSQCLRSARVKKSSDHAHSRPTLCHGVARIVLTAPLSYDAVALPLGAVAQKSPCKENRVIMGREYPFKLGQRGQDASQEAPMRTPKRLYP